MATEKRLIYLDHALQAVSENYRSDMPKNDLDMLVAARKRLKSMPTIDAVEVVRCKDCKLEGTEKRPMVHRDLIFGNLYAETKPDAFCSYGERRTDERKVD